MVGENMTLLSLSEALIYLINVQKSKLEKFYLKILSLSKKLSKKTFLKNMYIKTHGRLQCKKHKFLKNAQFTYFVNFKVK